MRSQTLSVITLAAVTIPQIVVALPIDSSSDILARELNDISMRDNEVLVARQPFLSKLLRKGKKMIGLRTNEADDLMARELESDDMLMAREYEDFLRRYFRSGI